MTKITIDGKIYYKRTLLLSCNLVDSKAAKTVKVMVITAGNSNIVCTNALYIGMAQRDAK